MSETVYHIKIKKEYASAILEDLQQVDAIQIVEEPLPAWQKEETLKRLAEIKSDPSSAISEDDFFKAIEEDGNEKL